jgi:hypothetical protein
VRKLFGISKKWEKQEDVNGEEKKCRDETGKQFEVFNHPNLGLPNNVVDSSGAGQFTSLETFALPRTMQFSLKFMF